MKAILAFLLLATMLLACNHEAPTNVSGRDDFSQVLIEVSKGDKPSTSISHLYLPAPWCPPAKADSISPWVEYCILGQRFIHRLTKYDIQNVPVGREDYYRIDFWTDYNDAVRVLLRYGNHRNGNDPDNASKANLKRDSPFRLLYQPTQNRKDDEYLLGFLLYQGQVYPLDNNSLEPIRAKIGISGNRAAGQNLRFYLYDFRYTSDIGIKSVVWQFSDGYNRFGEDVLHAFDRGGNQSVLVTIEDNFGKKVVVEETFYLN